MINEHGFDGNHKNVTEGFDFDRGCFEVSHFNIRVTQPVSFNYKGYTFV